MKTIDATKQALQDAIKHADDIAEKEGCTECGREHKQLADWLRELFFKRKEASKEEAIGSLRAAIAQPESEQCYCDAMGIGEPGVTCGDCPRDYKVQPDYVPLSDEQIKQIVIDACDQQFGTCGDIKFTDKDAEFYGIAFRAIEKAIREKS